MKNPAVLLPMIAILLCFSVTMGMSSPNLQDNGDGTITDLNTGLIWPKDGNSPAANNGTTTTQGGTAVFVNQLNAGGGFAGYTDWRVPNFKELASIAHYCKAAPAIDENFINIKQDNYWSSSYRCTRQPDPFVGEPGRYYGYVVNFNNASVNTSYYDGENSNSYYILPVRGPGGPSVLMKFE